jgi:prepilin-type processing-associated H-X9-DG protein/prepilin-type N-terminal cleavage/methylation domain-containing protein
MVGQRFFFQNPRRDRAFTMIELLVVVVVMTILGALLLPALSRSKSRAQAIMCMNNSRNLALAWTMYSGDNNERLAYNLGASAQLRVAFQTANANWVNNVMDWELSPGNTNLDFVAQSILAPYARYAARIFHCPADHALSAVQKQAGWTGRVRSVSMNAMVGNPGSLLQSGINVSNPGYQQFLKEVDFRDPSQIFVFLDEHPDSIDDGYFLDTPGTLSWVDLPASYHNGGGNFSFADGHTEIHRWQSAGTIQPAQPDVGLAIPVNPNDRADFDWVINHSSFAGQ